MKVAAGTKVSLEYTLTVEGQKLDSNVGEEPLAYTHGQNEIVPGLEKALSGMSAGESKKVEVQPDEAYGDLQSDAVIEVPKDQIPEEAQFVGAQLATKDPDGNVLRPRVTVVGDEKITLDFNHPLAGKVLNFDVKIVNVEAGITQ